jgi:hypothetical protein
MENMMAFPVRPNAWLMAIVALKNLRHQASKAAEKQMQKFCSFPDGPLHESFGMLAATDATV